MKHFFPSLALVLLASVLQAQITITSTYLPQIGDEIISHIDTNPSPGWYPTPGSGTAQTWDFTQSFNVDSVDTAIYVDPSGLGGVAAYPMANLGMVRSHDGIVENHFFSATNAGLMQLGMWVNMLSIYTITLTFNWIMWPTPLSYGMDQTIPQHWVTTGVVDPSLDEDANRTTSDWTQWLNIDAFGTLNTPAYPNGVQVLRMRSGWSGMRTDSIYVDESGTGNGPWVLDEVDTTSEPAPYRIDFLQASDHMLVASLSCDPVTHEVTSAVYVDGSGGSGIADFEATPTLGISPVPASSGNVWVDVPNGSTKQLVVRDVAGRMVQRYSVPGTTRFALPIDDFPVGPYTVEALGSAGERLAIGRLVRTR